MLTATEMLPRSTLPRIFVASWSSSEGAICARSLRSRKRWLTERRSTVARTPACSATPRPNPVMLRIAHQ
jgi:hypothetical protein